jgi:hypothetical protein
MRLLVCRGQAHCVNALARVDTLLLDWHIDALVALKKFGILRQYNVLYVVGFSVCERAHRVLSVFFVCFVVVVFFFFSFFRLPVSFSDPLYYTHSLTHSLPHARTHALTTLTHTHMDIYIHTYIYILSLSLVFPFPFFFFFLSHLLFSLLVDVCFPRFILWCGYWVLSGTMGAQQRHCQ